MNCLKLKLEARIRGVFMNLESKMSTLVEKLNADRIHRLEVKKLKKELSLVRNWIYIFLGNEPNYSG